jgi:ACT domain-containing protein
MELDQAKDIIVQAINAATLKGVYNVNDMVNIIEALKKLETVQDVEFVGDPKLIEDE